MLATRQCCGSVVDNLQRALGLCLDCSGDASDAEGYDVNERFVVGAGTCRRFYVFAEKATVYENFTWWTNDLRSIFRDERFLGKRGKTDFIGPSTTRQRLQVGLLLISYTTSDSPVLGSWECLVQR